MLNVPASEPDRLPRAPGGRVPGRIGTATRERLLASTAELLAAKPYRSITVTEVARGARTSPATYYQYFLDIESAVLALAEVTAQDGAQLSAPLLATRWRGADGWQNSLAIVDAFLTFWRDHQSILRVLDLLTEEGDERVRAVRVRMLNVVTRELSVVIEGVRTGSDARGADPMALAAVLVSMLAHVAAHQSRYEDWDISLARVRDAMADLVYWGITGPRVPDHPRPRPATKKAAKRAAT
jgi:AcrR family transcriptional regulator